MGLCYKAIELRKRGSHTVHCIGSKEGTEVPKHLLGIRAKMVSPGQASSFPSFPSLLDVGIWESSTIHVTNAWKC